MEEKIKTLLQGIGFYLMKMELIDSKVTIEIQVQGDLYTILAKEEKGYFEKMLNDKSPRLPENPSPAPQSDQGRNQSSQKGKKK